MKNDTICTTCLRLRQGLCDGEKELTACPSYKRMTNGERIRAMTDEELALFIKNTIVKEFRHRGLIGIFEPAGYWLDWLEQEVEDGH